MSLDLDRITHPLRLAAGSHQPGSGKGCAMNVISYINGDSKITDYPACSARPLARMVQRLNDYLAGVHGFLSPEDSVLVLDLGWQTVGTAGAPREVVWRWLSELLVDPQWGAAKRARLDGTAVIQRVAELCLRAADGDSPTSTEWREAADDYAYADAHAAATVASDVAATVAAYADADAAAAYADADAAAAYAAADAAAAAYAYAYVAAYAAVYSYANAAADAAADAADAAATFTRWTITRWRELAELDTPTDITTAAVDAALARFQPTT